MSTTFPGMEKQLPVRCGGNNALHYTFAYLTQVKNHAKVFRPKIVVVMLILYDVYIQCYYS